MELHYNDMIQSAALLISYSLLDHRYLKETLPHERKTLLVVKGVCGRFSLDSWVCVRKTLISCQFVSADVPFKDDIDNWVRNCQKWYKQISSCLYICWLVKEMRARLDVE